MESDKSKPGTDGACAIDKKWTDIDQSFDEIDEFELEALNYHHRLETTY